MMISLICVYCCWNTSFTSQKYKGFFLPLVAPRRVHFGPGNLSVFPVLVSKLFLIVCSVLVPLRYSKLKTTVLVKVRN